MLPPTIPRPASPELSKHLRYCSPPSPGAAHVLSSPRVKPTTLLEWPLPRPLASSPRPSPPGGSSHLEGPPTWEQRPIRGLEMSTFPRLLHGPADSTHPHILIHSYSKFVKLPAMLIPGSFPTVAMLGSMWDCTVHV